MKKGNWKTEFDQAAGALPSTPEMQRLRALPHHRHISRYDHTMTVAERSFRWARRLGLDEQSAVRGALLHDLFFYDSTSHSVSSRVLLFRHPEEAAENAARLTELSDKEKNIILSHMWPLSRHAPRSLEALVVNIADTVTAIQDYFHGNHT